MSEIGKWVTDQIFKTEPIVIYPGRFQPMGKHHNEVYNKLKEQFENVYIATSNKTELPNSPFNFHEKKQIIESYGISSDNIIEVSQPYVCTEITKQYPEDTPVLFVLGKKDYKRLSGSKFFHEWNNNPTLGYKDGAYLIIAEHENITIEGTELCASEIRRMLGNNTLSEDKRKLIYQSIFGNTTHYKMITDKLKIVESQLVKFANKSNLINILKESSQTATTLSTGGRGATDADDGPGFLYPKMKNFKHNTSRKAERLGWEVVNYLVPDMELEKFPKYPNAAIDTVSYFPSGVVGKKTPMNQKDYKSTQAYNAWKKHITKIVGNIGYEFVNWKKEEDAKTSNKQEPNKQKQETNISEGIDLPVEVGQTVFMGKWKNKPVKVKTIEWNEKGDLMINGKSALRMRIPNQTNVFSDDPRYVNEEEEDIYDKTIKYTYETPDGKKVDREITYGSVISQGDEHPLYKQIRKEIDDYKSDKKDEK